MEVQSWLAFPKATKIHEAVARFQARFGYLPARVIVPKTFEVTDKPDGVIISLGERPNPLLLVGPIIGGENVST